MADLFWAAATAMATAVAQPRWQQLWQGRPRWLQQIACGSAVVGKTFWMFWIFRTFRVVLVVLSTSLICCRLFAGF